MVKKLSCISLILMFSLISILPILASTSNVINDLGYLTDSEVNSLQAEIDNIKNTYGLEPVIVFVDDASVTNSIAYADDYFDYNGYGVGNDNEGILFLVDMYNRQLVISTTGPSTINRYEYEWMDMRDILAPYLTDQEYNEACIRFLEMVVSVETTGNVTSYGYRLARFAATPIPYGIGFVIALIATVIITLSSKGKVTITNRTYESANSFQLTHQIDKYVREHTTKRKIETKSSSGGSRTGSSGSSHGGGGGGF